MQIQKINNEGQDGVNYAIRKFKQINNGVWFDKEKHKLVFQKANIHLTVGKHKM